jgi:hypothetical protein
LALKFRFVNGATHPPHVVFFGGRDMTHALNSLRSFAVLSAMGAAFLGSSVAQAACQVAPGMYCIKNEVVVVYSDCTYENLGAACGGARAEEGVPAETTLEQFLAAGSFEAK